MFNSVGIIGSGTVGRAIAHHALVSGRAVRIVSTKPVPELQSFLDSHQLHARAVELPEAASADLVVLAVPFVYVGDVGTAIGDWTGKVVVDATNQFATANPYQGRADTEGLTGSEWVAAKLPGATVIKAFNAMFGAFIAADPRHAEGRQIVFFAADPSPAKDAFAHMVAGFGFAPVDLGSLADGGRLIQLDGPLSGVNALRQS